MKTIIILDKQDNYDDIIYDLKINDESKIFSIDHKTHEVLTNNRIEHVLGDIAINTETRLRIHQESFRYLKWYKNFDNQEFEFGGRNMLDIIDDNEFQILLSEKLSKIFCIKNILDNEKAEKIITTYEIYKIIKSLKYNCKIELISKTNNEEKLFFDTIEINFNSKILPKRIKLSRRRYLWVKNFLENLVSKVYRLEYRENEQNSLLFVEFNPELYDQLLYEIKNCKMQPVLVNFRRSSVWSKKSIDILKNSNAKIATYDYFLDKIAKNRISMNTELFRKKFTELFDNDSILKKIFSIDGIEFWDIIKTQISNMYLSRIEERLSYIIISEKLFNKQKFRAVITLNLSGETEKIFSHNDNTPSVLLQHAFGNYSKDIKSLELTDDLNLIKDKIAVWGNTMKDYLIDNYQILEENVIVSGSPRHDSFFINKSNMQDEKYILLTPRPIIQDIEGENSIKYEQYKTTIEEILNIIKKNNLKLVVKLHPQKNDHNEKIIDIIKSVDPEIQIFQAGSIFDLLKKCSLMINLSPDNYDASTTILEAMIMKKPIIDISLVKKRYNFEFLKDRAIYALDTSSDIEKAILELQYDYEIRAQLIKRSQIHLEKYLANHGNASKILAQTLSNIN